MQEKLENAVYYGDKNFSVYWRWDEIETTLRDWAAFKKNCKNCSEESHFFILQSKFLVSKKTKIWPSSEFELDCTNNNDFDSKKNFLLIKIYSKKIPFAKSWSKLFPKIRKVDLILIY